MKTNYAAPYDRHHRYPAEIIAGTVWLYFRFSLSFRDVEEQMSARGVARRYETVRRWTLQFGQHYANQLKRLGDAAPDLVLLDYWLPDMDGAQFLETMVDRRWAIPVVFMSGVSEAKHVANGLGAAWLLKPYTCDQLLAALGPSCCVDSPA